MNTQSQKLLSAIKPGQVYRREELIFASKSADRVLRELVTNGKLIKLEPSFYFLPKSSRWGTLPASLEDLATAFLKETDYLILTNGDYNSLGLGLTQLWNEVRVYNKKRHIKLKLAHYNFSFERPNNGYPSKLSKEFLLVDLINSINNIGEEPNLLKERVGNNLDKFDKIKLEKLSNEYGKVGTKKFFNGLLRK